MTPSGLIGRENKLPWSHNSADMAHFANHTKSHIVIYGRKTWESMSCKPLKSRVNIIVSSSITTHPDGDDIYIVSCMEDAICICRRREYSKKRIWIIGGGQLYHWVLERRWVKDMVISCISAGISTDISAVAADDDGDTAAAAGVRPLTGAQAAKAAVYLSIPWSDFKVTDTYQLDDTVKVSVYKYINSEERAMLTLTREILNRGELRNNRTGIYTKSLFGHQLEFSLKYNTLPLLTSRRQPVRWIMEELLWILRGQTSVKPLEDRGITIWSKYAGIEYTTPKGLPIGDIGPSYGFQMRHFGAIYYDSTTSYDGQGVDQLMETIRLLQEDPTSRRIIISLWNPMDVDKATLPPCLFQYQFFVSADRQLDCMMTNRSSDIAVAGGWNVTFAALFTHILALICGLTANRLIWNMGDTHVYENNIDAAKTWCDRATSIFPKIRFKRAPILRPLTGAQAAEAAVREVLSTWTADDIECWFYAPEPPISFVIN